MKGSEGGGDGERWEEMERDGGRWGKVGGDGESSKGR